MHEMWWHLTKRPAWAVRWARVVGLRRGWRFAIGSFALGWRVAGGIHQKAREYGRAKRE